jgi:hypothetical protein
MLSHEDLFHLEKQRARTRGVADHSTFSGVLSRHALVMFDAANPDLDKTQCIKLGTRLAEIQTDWIGLLCGGDAQKEYKRAVAGIVKTFTNKLMDVVVDDKRVTFDELASIGLVHSHLSPNDQRRFDETRELFQHYVASLCRLHNGRCQNIHMAGLQVLQVANVLGASLDFNIYK